MNKIEKIYQLFRKNHKVCTDTRKISGGEIFFALKGEKFDANQFAKQALEKGALAAVIDNPEFFISEDKTILVDDTLQALQQLANLHRKKLNVNIFALTGTNGKTTTKELIARVLSKKFSTYATEGNLNNHIGVPLTLLKIKPEHQIAVVEMGASIPHDIENLCKIAEPDFGLITNIGTAHIKGFGSPQVLINTKKELYDFLIEKKGVIFINIDNPILKKIIGNYDKIFTYGFENGQVRGKVIKANPFIVVEYQWEGKNYQIKTSLFGKYNLENVLAAVAVGKFFDIDDDKIIEAIESYYPQNNRSQIEKTKDNNLIRDLYNANPTSMLAALENFDQLSAQKKAVILGDMLELGNVEIQKHKEILNYLADKNFKVFLVGDIFSKINENKNFLSFPNVEDLANYLQKNPLKNFWILIKGSRGIHLEKILPYL